MAFLDKVKNFFGIGKDKEDPTNPVDQLNKVQSDFGDISLTSQETPEVLAQTMPEPARQAVQIETPQITANQIETTPTAPTAEAVQIESVNFQESNVPEIESALAQLQTKKQEVAEPLQFTLPQELPAAGSPEDTFDSDEDDIQVQDVDYWKNTREETAGFLSGAWRGISDWVTGEKSKPYNEVLDGGRRKAGNHRDVVEQNILNGGGYEDYLSGIDSIKNNFDGDTNIFGNDKFTARFGEDILSREEYSNIVGEVKSDVIERNRKRNETISKENAAYQNMGYKDSTEDFIEKAAGVFLTEDIPSYEWAERQKTINGFQSEIEKFNVYTKSSALNYERMVDGGNASESTIQGAKKSIDLMDEIVKGVGDKSIELMEVGRTGGKTAIRDFMVNELSAFDGAENLNFGELENLYYKKDFINKDWSQYGLDEFFVKHKDISPEDLLGVLQSDVNQREARANIGDSENVYESIGNLFGSVSKGSSKVFNLANLFFERDVLNQFTFGLGDVAENTFIGSLGYNQLSNIVSRNDTGSSGDFEFTKQIRSSDEIGSKPKNRLANAKRAVLRARQGSPEFLTLVAEIVAPVPKVGALSKLSRAEKIVEGMIDFGVGVDKAKEYGAAFAHAEHMVNDVINRGLKGVKEVVIESQAGALSERQGSEADDALMSLGIGLGLGIELMPSMKLLQNMRYDRAGFQSFINGNIAAKEVGGEAWDEVSVGAIRALGKMKVEAVKALPDADVNTLLKSMMKKGIEHKAIVDDIADNFIRDAALARSLGNGSIDDVNVNAVSQLNATDGLLSTERQGLLQELDVLVNDPKVTFNSMLETLTGLPFGEAKRVSTVIQRTPTYKVLRSVAEAFPNNKPITAATEYTLREVNEIAEKTKGTQFDFFLKNEDGSFKYFELDSSSKSDGVKVEGMQTKNIDGEILDGKQSYRFTSLDNVGYRDISKRIRSESPDTFIKTEEIRYELNELYNKFGYNVNLQSVNEDYLDTLIFNNRQKYDHSQKMVDSYSRYIDDFKKTVSDINELESDIGKSKTSVDRRSREKKRLASIINGSNEISREVRDDFLPFWSKKSPSEALEIFQKRLSFHKNRISSLQSDMDERLIRGSNGAGGYYTANLYKNKGYSETSPLIRIFNSDSESVFIHEFSHHLNQFLPPKEQEIVNNLYKKDFNEASKKYLKLLEGNTIKDFSGLSVQDKINYAAGKYEGNIPERSITKQDIDYYLRSGEPLDRGRYKEEGIIKTIGGDDMEKINSVFDGEDIYRYRNTSEFFAEEMTDAFDRKATFNRKGEFSKIIANAIEFMKSVFGYKKETFDQFVKDFNKGAFSAENIFIRNNSILESKGGNNISNILYSDLDTFKLKIEEMGDDMGITKLKYTDEELGKLAASEEGFIKTMQSVNSSAGQSVYNVEKITRYGMYNTLNETLSKILC